MKKCVFCNINTTKIYNTILDVTDNFIVMPTLGSLVDGYVLIVSKHHIYNMAELSNKEKEEYIKLINKYREVFHKIYGKYPIVFEHGTSRNDITLTSSSVIHAHTHIVNHSFKNELEIINDLNLKETDINNILSDKNYIFYISQDGKKYITYNYKSTSQLMRILIAKDLGYETKYNWKNDAFLDNIEKTINKIRNDRMNNIEEKYLYEFDINDTFFDSLRLDYKDFNDWFKRNNKRKVYVTFNGGKITSFLMLKLECNEKYDFDKEFSGENILKICTMKVSDNGIGIGEEFIKIIFNEANELNVDKIYFTVYPKYIDLINFFSKYGFKLYSTKNTMNNNNEINKEYVYVRELWVKYLCL